MTDIESLIITVDGCRLHYLKAGTGPPVVLIHGGASDSRDWLGTMRALADSYTLYAPDVIGYGQSDRDDNGYYFSDFVRFTLGFIESLELDSCALVGHSLGGRLCLELAFEYPERVKKLGLVDTAGFGKMSAVGSVLNTFSWFLRKLMHQPQPFPTFLKKDDEEFDWLCLNRLSELKVPTMIIWKRFDLYFPVSLAYKAKRLMPHAQLAVLPGFGHAPHIINTTLFNSVLLDFLKAAQGSSSFLTSQQPHSH